MAPAIATAAWLALLAVAALGAGLLRSHLGAQQLTQLAGPERPLIVRLHPLVAFLRRRGQAPGMLGARFPGQES